MSSLRLTQLILPQNTVPHCQQTLLSYSNLSSLRLTQLILPQNTVPHCQQTLLSYSNLSSLRLTQLILPLEDSPTLGERRAAEEQHYLLFFILCQLFRIQNDFTLCRLSESSQCMCLDIKWEPYMSCPLAENTENKDSGISPQGTNNPTAQHRDQRIRLLTLYFNSLTHL